VSYLTLEIRARHNLPDRRRQDDLVSALNRAIEEPLVGGEINATVPLLASCGR
jgi:hypothetical protein